ncbi:hypothetical protein GCM10023082_01110 [Streptomyces tremellae]|uniref:Transposase n=1 Tax=Streptomyces tremellae TaxID=1124239 RepID=A0ABP7DKE9_9ACTN
MRVKPELRVRRRRRSVSMTESQRVRSRQPGARLAAGASPRAPDRWARVQEWQKLGHVMPVAAGERDGERGPVTVDDHMVFRVGAGRSTGEGPT